MQRKQSTHVHVETGLLWLLYAKFVIAYILALLGFW